MIGLTVILAETFRSLHTRVVETPWTGPDGEKLELEIRVHDDPAYQEALAGLEVDPMSTTDRDRKRPQGTPLQGLTGQPLSADDQAVAERLDRDQEEIVSIGFPWNSYPVTYSMAEVAKVAAVVRKHLVVGAWTVKASGNDGAKDRVAATEEEVTQWFLSEALIPRQLPESSAGVAVAMTRLKAARNSQSVYLGGQKEGVAVAAFVLRESVQEHLFKERLDPLSSGSASTPGGALTTEGSQAPRPASGPSSQKVPGDASPASAQDPPSSGSPATVETATG